MRPFFIPLLVLALAVSAPPALATSTISCHCFKDRTFDPARPAAIDPYLLATARNGLFAAVFGVPKAEVVKALMGGIPAETLWLNHFVAARTGVDPGRVAMLRSEVQDWPAILQILEGGPEVVGDRFFKGVLKKAPDEVLASMAVDTVLATRLGIGEETLAALGRAGAGDRERVLASYLGRRTGRPPTTLYAEAITGSWGSLVTAAGIDPGAIDEEIAALLGPPRREERGH